MNPPALDAIVHHNIFDVLEYPDNSFSNLGNQQTDLVFGNLEIFISGSGNLLDLSEDARHNPIFELLFNTHKLYSTLTNMHNNFKFNENKK